MARWLSGFILVCLLDQRSSRLCGQPFLTALSLGLLLYGLGQRKRPLFLAWPCLLLAGALWALTQRAPQPVEALFNVVILPQPFLSFESNYHWVESRGQVLQVKGPATAGSRGDVRLFKRQSLWQSQQALFTPDPRQPGEGPSFWQAWGLRLRGSLATAIHAQPWLLRPWLQSLFLGDQTILGSSKQTFRDLGLLHILVISGYHISLFASLIQLLMRLPLQLLYSVRLLSPQAFCQALVLCDFMALLGAWVYGFASLLGQAAQRALILFSLSTLLPHFCGRVAFLHRLCFAAFLQALFFPMGFWEDANLMSWGAYLSLVLCFKTSCHSSFSSLLQKHLCIQLVISLICIALFGTLSLSGIVLNLLLTPVMPLLFMTALGLLMVSQQLEPLYQLCFVVQLAFLRGLEKLGQWSERIGLPLLDWTEERGLRWLFLLVAIGLLFNFWWQETMRASRAAGLGLTNKRVSEKYECMGKPVGGQKSDGGG